MIKRGNVAKSMQCPLKHQVVEAGQNIKLVENPNLRHWHKTWVDEINDILWKRHTTIKGEENEKIVMSNNKTLMQHAMDYIQQNDNEEGTLKQINFVHLKKKLCLPCEFVGCMGKTNILLHKHKRDKFITVVIYG